MNLNLNFNLNLNLDSSDGLDENKIYDVLIIGGGPAGLNAALYAKRKGLEVGIISKKSGGQIIDTSTVENYLGFPEITGEKMVKIFEEHVNDLSVPISQKTEVNTVDLVEGSHIKKLLTQDGKTFQTKSLIIATGSVPRRLGVPGEDHFYGKGVSYCTICDAPLYKDLHAVVVGGGNTAIEAVLDLAKLAKKVTLVHRSQLRADKILLDRLNNFLNIDIYLETEVLSILGDKKLSGIKVLDKKEAREYEIEADGVFIQIGNIPTNNCFKHLLQLNDAGEIIVDKIGRTSIEGIFAAGDITDTPYKQIITAAADGARCALSAGEYLNTLEE